MILNVAWVTLAVLLLTTEGCGGTEPGDTKAANERSPPIGSVDRVSRMTSIEIVSGSHKWTAKIDDGPAARDFLAQLPLTLTLKDYGRNEKIADLPRPLTREGAPDAVTPQAGDVAFYAPWGNLAIFYRDGLHSPGLIRLGRLDSDPAEFAGKDPLPVRIRQAERSE